MNDYRKGPYIVFIVILLMFLLGIIIYVIYDNNINKNAVYSPLINYEMHDKVYGVNEYSNVIVSSQQMANIYLANYLFILRTDLQRAYSMVDADYIKNNNFDYQSFVNFVSKINFSNTTVDKYSVSEDIYYVVDKMGNTFIFETDGVMTYTVKFSQ